MGSVGSNAIADFLSSAAVKPTGLVVEGEAGIGKSTLWLAAGEHARERGFRMLSAQPSTAESVQAYASLADLLDGVDAALWADLPGPQRLALDQVLLRAESQTPATDHRAVAAAFLSVIGRLSDQSPILLAIDDLQWLDPSTVHVVEFAARRLRGPVGVLAAERTNPTAGTTASWLRLPRPDAMRRIQVSPLSLGALHQVLSERLGRTFPRPTMGRIHEISGGNPFYAIELARAIQGDATLSESALPGTLSELVRSRIGSLDPDVQQALLAAACAAAPTVELIAGATSVDAADVVRLLEEAECNGIIGIIGRTIRFAHPLLAQGVYANAGPARRRAMHQCLAGIVEQPELQARHLALATTTHDPRTLLSLDEAASIARTRGAPAAAAELLELAMLLGGDTPERRLRLAKYHLDAGDLVRPRAVLEQTIQALAPSEIRAEALTLLAVVRLADDSYLEAIDYLERALGDVGENLALRVQILTTVSFCLSSVGDPVAAFQRAEDAVTHAESLRRPHLLSQALSMHAMLNMTLGNGVDEPSLRRALEMEDRDADTHILVRPRMQNITILGWTCRFDEGSREALSLRASCLERGEETEVIIAALVYVLMEAFRGNFADAYTIADDAMDRALQAGGDQSMACALTMRATLGAYTGRMDEARRDGVEALAACHRLGGSTIVPWLITMLGFIEVSTRNYLAALTALEPLLASLDAHPRATECFIATFIPDAIEAFVAVHRLDEAEGPIAALEANGRRLDRPWMLAIGARCRAMLQSARGDLEGANLSARQAMIEHDRLSMPFERARTQLLVGQLHRRTRQKDAASAALRDALQTFEKLGTPLWAQRARAELGRVDVGTRQPTGLTQSEQRVAELAASGMTNRDVAAALFISPKTVEANLSRVYHKLGIRSRAELGRRFGQPDGAET